MKQLYKMRLSLFFLALCLLFGSLSGCNEPSNTPTPSPKPTETVEPFLLTTELRVIRGENADAVEKSALVRLSKGITEKTGLAVTPDTDWVKHGEDFPTGYEILVGHTNRPEDALAADLDAGQYIICRSGNRVLICGGMPSDTAKAVDIFLAEYVTANGFTFENDSTLMRIGYTETITDLNVEDNMKGTLTVNTANVINEDIIGGGVNFDFSSYVFINLVNGGEWGSGNLRSQHIPFSTVASEVDKLWEEYFKLIDQSGMQYVRLNVSFTMWEPINDNDDPNVTDFEKGFIFSPGFKERTDLPAGTETGFPNLNYAYLKAFYRLLDYFEEKNLYVILANWDNGSEALGFCPNNTNWLASTDKDGNKLGRGNELNIIDLDEYAETFAAIMYHLVKEKNYTCVKGFSFYNEPENLKNTQETLVKCYNVFGKHLRRLGIRNEVMIQAFDGSVFWMAGDNGREDRITAMDEECGANMDIISEHMYLATLESGRKLEGTDVRGTFSSYVVPQIQKMVEQGNSRPVVLGELGTFAFNDKSGETSVKNYLSRLFAAEAAIEGFNAGIKGYGLWIYNCYLHNYYTMLAYDSKNPRLIVPDAINYYPSALIMSAFPSGTDILECTVAGCSTDYQHVWACVGKLPNGKISILLVNDGAEPASLSLAGLDGLTFSYRYVNAEHTDNIYTSSDVNGEVFLGGDSIVVLTQR